MIRRVNLALMETVLAERCRATPAQHPLAEYVRDWKRSHNLPLAPIAEPELGFTVSLNGHDE